MIPIERQMLLNQIKIMELLRGLYPKKQFDLGGGEEDLRICETLEFLKPKGAEHPKEHKEDCDEMGTESPELKEGKEILRKW